MHNVRLKKSIARIFTFALLLSFSGSGQGFVLCWGYDGHMHLEATFNGVDCGHFPLSSETVNSNQYLTGDSSFATAPCYSCTDIPLAFPHYLLKQHRYAGYSHNGKTAIIIAALPVSHSTLIPHGLHPARGPILPIKSHRALNQILSNILRI